MVCNSSRPVCWDVVVVVAVAVAVDACITAAAGTVVNVVAVDIATGAFLRFALDFFPMTITIIRSVKLMLRKNSMSRYEGETIIV